MPVRGTGGTVLGFVGVGWDDHHEVDVATEARLALVAELCGLTLQRALLLEWEHDVSATLQYALLGEMEEPKGLAVASRYLPATQGVQIGGDLVDVVDLHDGRAAVVVGDVVGHGLQAAATMGQLRIAVRVLARTASGPAELLDALAPFLEDVAEVRFSTLAVAFVDGGAQTLTYAAAGHPPAILVDEGRTRLLDGAQNTLLGVRGVDHAEVVVPWRAGSTLVSYTDGLVERRGVPVTEDIERLRLVVDEVASRGVDVVADELLERLRPQRFDDTALLVVRAEG
jgi:serine phosphatase RsbU (regulator of sigma subunit)